MKRSFISQPFAISHQNFNNKFLLDHSIKLNHAYFYYGDDNEVKISEYINHKIYLIGYILDIRDSNLGEENILRILLETYVKNNDDFFDELQYMNGRYALIIDSETDTIVYSDATGLRPLFHWNNEVISSHEIIIRESLKDEHDINLDMSTFKMKNFLDYTNTNEIYKFNPNMMFSFNNMNFDRFYPTLEFENQSIEKVIQHTQDYFMSQVDWLNKNYENIYQSLTGGFDAKLSLAINKPILNKVELFTYMYRFEEDTAYEELSKFKKIYYNADCKIKLDT